jgi:hypothetical protein
MPNSYELVLELLASGACIEQVSEAPRAYRLCIERESMPIQGGLMQQLLAHRRIVEVCRVSGRLRFVAATSPAGCRS